MSEKVAIFVDGSNFYHGLQRAFRKASIHFGKLTTKLTAGRTLVRTYYYNAPRREEDDPSKYREQQKFLESLKRLDYFEVKLGRLESRSRRCPRCNQDSEVRVEKGTDVTLACDMLRFAYRKLFDTAVLVAEDSDFVSAIEGVKELGFHVEVAFPKRPYHLAGLSDRFILLDRQFLQDCWL